jgi:hypothetical protein
MEVVVDDCLFSSLSCVFGLGVCNHVHCPIVRMTYVDMTSDMQVLLVPVLLARMSQEEWSEDGTALAVLSLHVPHTIYDVSI